MLMQPRPMAETSRLLLPSIRFFTSIHLLLMLMACGAGSASAFVHPDRGAVTVGPLVNISFWGRPYPYGYVGWGPCVRYVPVQTASGPKLRKVRVCRYATW